LHVEELLEIIGVEYV